MASIRFLVKSVKKSAVNNYAELTGESGSYARRGDLVASQHGNMPSWAVDDPKAFWRAAFKYERQNGSVCRVYDVALPDQLSVDQNVELSNRYIRELASDKPYQGELVKVSRGVHVNRSLHLRLMVSERVEDGIERLPEQTFKRYNAAHPERGGRRKDGCGKSKAEMGNELKQTRRLLTDLQERALFEVHRNGSPRLQVDGYASEQGGREQLHAYAGNQTEHSRYGCVPGDVVYRVS